MDRRGGVKRGLPVLVVVGWAEKGNSIFLTSTPQDKPIAYNYYCASYIIHPMKSTVLRCTNQTITISNKCLICRYVSVADGCSACGVGGAGLLFNPLAPCFGALTFSGRNEPGRGFPSSILRRSSMSDHARASDESSNFFIPSSFIAE